MSITEKDLYRDTPVRYLGMIRGVMIGAHATGLLCYIIMPIGEPFSLTPIFYFWCIEGYANEIGEAFRPVIKKIFVHASYAVAISYVLADTADKSKKQYDVRRLNHVSLFGRNEFLMLLHLFLLHRNRKYWVEDSVERPLHPATRCCGKCLPPSSYPDLPSIG